MSHSSSRHITYDILGVVAEHADRQTAARMMICCRALYRYTAPVLLAEPVDLDLQWGPDEVAPHADHILSFHRFMAVEDGRRWRFLRGLIIGPTLPGPPEVVSALAQGILQASNLEYLELTYIDDLLAGYGDIRDALARLPNVKHLKVAHAAKHACTFLENVRWPLVTVQLDNADEMESGDWELPKIRQRLHPASLLRWARDTLVEVSCDLWNRNAPEYCDHFPDYPGVTTLHQQWIRWPTTPEWVKTYPNLTHLLVHTVATEDSSCLDERLEYVRRNNLQALEQRCWPHLEEVRASCLEDFYLLGLPCHVRKVDLGWAMGWIGWGLSRLPEALEHIRPVAVELSTHGDTFEAAFKTYFEQSITALQDLEELQLRVDFERNHLSTGVDVARVLVSVQSSFVAPLDLG